MRNMESDLTHSSTELLHYIKEHEPDFLALILQKLGIVVHTHQLIDLHKTIIEACKKFSCTPEEYLNALGHCAYDSPFLEHLVTGITIGETYFFRDNRQIDLLQNNLLPTLIANKRKQGDLSLRIWSAGCATGEEIYTIAMILKETLSDHQKWNIQLMATDINMESLQKAMRGIYSQWSMRTIDSKYKDKYFSKKENFYFLSKELRGLVNFSYLNLKDDSYPSIYNSTNAQDLILCRNVLIYFDNPMIEQLMQKISKCLIPGGCLVLGASDPVLLKDTGLVFRSDESVYFLKPITPIEPIKEIKASIKTYEKPVIIPPIKSTKRAPSAQLKKETVSKFDPEVISHMLSQSQWQETLNAIDKLDPTTAKSVFILIAKAAALANLGKLQPAVECCQTALSLDATNKKAHFMYALILLELNQLSEAEAMLRKTLFLDHQFVEGHFQLGLLLLRNKKIEAGLKSLQIALKIVQKADPAQRVSDLHGLTFKQFSDVLENEIRLYSLSKDTNNGK